MRKSTEKQYYGRAVLLALLLHLSLFMGLWWRAQNQATTFSMPAFAPIQAVIVPPASQLPHTPSSPEPLPNQPKVVVAQKELIQPLKPKVTPPRRVQQKQNVPSIKNDIRQLLQQSLAHDSQTQLTAQSSAQVARYHSLIVKAISRHWIIPPDLNEGLQAELTIRLAPGGIVLEVSLVKSSGNPALDRSAQAAVYKASPLPISQNSAEFAVFRQFNLIVRPTELLANR